MPMYSGKAVVTTTYEVDANNPEAAKEIIAEVAAEDALEAYMLVEDVYIKDIEEVK